MLVRQLVRWTPLLFWLVSSPVTAQGYGPSSAMPIPSKPATGRIVAIMGQVARPDVYEFADPTPTLFDVVRRAGGLTSKASTQLRILRSGRAGQSIFFQPNLSLSLDTGDVLFADKTDRDAHKMPASIEQANYSPWQSTEPDPPAQSRVLIGLVNLFDTPVLLSLPPEHATLAGLMSILGQPLDVCADVRVLSSHAADEAEGSMPKEHWPLDNGTVLDFGRAEIDHAKIPVTLPDGVFYKPVGRPRSAETAVTASSTSDTSPIATPGESRTLSNEADDVHEPPGGPALTHPSRTTRSVHASNAPLADNRGAPSIPKSTREQAAGIDTQGQVQETGGSFAVKQRLPCLASAVAHPHGLIAPAGPNPRQTLIADQTSPAKKGADGTVTGTKRGNFAAIWNDWAISTIWALGIAGSLLSVALLAAMARKAAAFSVSKSVVDRFRQNPLEALIRDQLPLDEETVQLPLNHRFFAGPAGRPTIRVDGSHQAASPHLILPSRSTSAKPSPVPVSVIDEATATSSLAGSSARAKRSTRLKGADVATPSVHGNIAGAQPAVDTESDVSPHFNAGSGTAGNSRSGMLDRALDSLRGAAER